MAREINKGSRSTTGRLLKQEHRNGCCYQLFLDVSILFRQSPAETNSIYYSYLCPQYVHIDRFNGAGCPRIMARQGGLSDSEPQSYTSRGISRRCVSFFVSDDCQGYAFRRLLRQTYRLRAGRPAIRLKTTNRSITQLADDFHFSDQAAFTKFFTRMKGISPKKFRKGK